jgi:hypothetical protein
VLVGKSQSTRNVVRKTNGLNSPSRPNKTKAMKRMSVGFQETMTSEATLNVPGSETQSNRAKESQRLSGTHSTGGGSSQGGVLIKRSGSKGFGSPPSKSNNLLQVIPSQHAYLRRFKGDDPVVSNHLSVGNNNEGGLGEKKMLSNSENNPNNNANYIVFARKAAAKQVAAPNKDSFKETGQHNNNTNSNNTNSNVGVSSKINAAGQQMLQQLKKKITRKRGSSFHAKEIGDPNDVIHVNVNRVEILNHTIEGEHERPRMEEESKSGNSSFDGGKFIGASPRSPRRRSSTTIQNSKGGFTNLTLLKQTKCGKKHILLGKGAQSLRTKEWVKTVFSGVQGSEMSALKEFKKKIGIVYRSMEREAYRIGKHLGKKDSEEYFEAGRTSIWSKIPELLDSFKKKEVTIDLNERAEENHVENNNNKYIINHQAQAGGATTNTAAENQAKVLNTKESTHRFSAVDNNVYVINIFAPSEDLLRLDPNADNPETPNPISPIAHGGFGEITMSEGFARLAEERLENERMSVLATPGGKSSSGGYSSNDEHGVTKYEFFTRTLETPSKTYATDTFEHSFDQQQQLQASDKDSDDEELDIKSKRMMLVSLGVGVGDMDNKEEAVFGKERYEENLFARNSMEFLENLSEIIGKSLKNDYLPRGGKLLEYERVVLGKLKTKIEDVDPYIFTPIFERLSSQIIYVHAHHEIEAGGLSTRSFSGNELVFHGPTHGAGSLVERGPSLHVNEEPAEEEKNFEIDDHAYDNALASGVMQFSDGDSIEFISFGEKSKCLHSPPAIISTVDVRIKEDLMTRMKKEWMIINPTESFSK